MAEIEQTVFVVDDDAAILESIADLVQSIGLKVLTFTSGQAFLDNYLPEEPGCLVLDLRMPGMGGLGLQSVLAQRGIDIPIIFISGFGDVSAAAKAFKAGAADFIEKPFSNQVFLDSVLESLAIDRTNRAKKSQLQEINSRLGQLTPRQHQIMGMIVDGQANKVIASKLNLSQRTVEVHRAAIMSKMQADSLAQLVKLSVTAL